MGFLSKVTGSLTGGGGKSSSTQNSGYGALPKFQQQALASQTQGVQQFINPLNADNSLNLQNIQRFTPMGETADEAAAYDLIRQGFTPTAQGLQDDLQTLQNPYLDSVIGRVNREAYGANSMLQQSLNSAGQFGSNRSILGANDIDMAKADQIGSLLSDNYNTNLNYALTTLPALRAADATGLAGIGADQRALSMQQQLAPVTALQAGAGILSSFPASSTSTQTQSSGGGGLLGGVGGLLSGVGSLGGLGSIFGGAGISGVGSSNILAGLGAIASDRRLKTDIEEVGEENGHKLYKFKYDTVKFPDLPKGEYIGVMSDDVRETNPDAIQVMDNGYDAVDYSKLGLEVRKA